MCSKARHHLGQYFGSSEIAQPTESPCTNPYARWCDRESPRGRPMSIPAQPVARKALNFGDRGQSPYQVCFPGGAKLHRSPLTQAAVGLFLVVILPPAKSNEPGLGHTVKLFQVQTFILELVIKAFAIVVLPGAAGIDVMGLYPGTPVANRSRPEPRILARCRCGNKLACLVPQTGRPGPR